MEGGGGGWREGKGAEENRKGWGRERKRTKEKERKKRVKRKGDREMDCENGKLRHT